MPGLDTVTNLVGCTGGQDVETDAALRDRFRNFINSRSRATRLAIQYAVSSVQQGLRSTVQENVLPDMTPRMGSILVTVDDGSGAPPAALLSRVAAAVELVRPMATSFAVVPPIVIAATIELTVATTPGGNHTTIALAASSAIASWVNALPIGTALPYSRLAQLAYGADSGIVNVVGVRLNGGTADLVPTQSGVVRAVSVTVS